MNKNPHLDGERCERRIRACLAALNLPSHKRRIRFRSEQTLYFLLKNSRKITTKFYQFSAISIKSTA